MSKGDKCKIKHCEKLVTFSGLVCNAHRYLKRVNGEYDSNIKGRAKPHKRSRAHNALHTRKNFFYSKTGIPNEHGCMIWTGGINSQGYGQISNHPLRAISAHRYSYAMHHGHFDPSLWVLHHCDNPPCVAPDHLFLGDRKANMKDCARKGRLNFQQRSAR